MIRSRIASGAVGATTVLSRIAVVVSVIALLSGSCSSGDSEDAGGGGEAPRAARNLGVPRAGRLLNEPGPVTVVQGLGSFRSIPVTSTWPDDLAIVGDDFATVTALDCSPGSSGCETADLDELATGDIDVVSIATVGADRATPSVIAAAAQRLEDLSIEVIGYGPSIDGAVAPAVLIGEVHTLAFHAISFNPNLTNTAGNTTAGIAGPDAFDLLLEAISISDANDHRTIVVVDWGAEEARAPNPAQVALAQRLIAAGADAIIGNGSLHLQRLERIQSAPVVYSLGDATSSASSQLELDTAVMRIEFGSGLLSACLLPATASPTGPTLDSPSRRFCP